MSKHLRLLFIAPQGLGDSLQLTPLLPSLRRNHPDATIDVVVLRPTAEQLFAGLPDLVDGTYHLPYWSKGIGAFAVSLAKFAASHRYDMSFLAYPAARREYHVLQALIPAKARFAHAYGKTPATSLGWPLHKRRILPLAAVSNVLRNAQLVNAAGLDVDLAETYVIPEQWKGRRLKIDPAGAIVIHIGSVNHDSFAGKRWPVEYFIELSNRLVQQGRRVIYLSGPDERDETQAAAEATPGATIFEGDLAETTSLLSRATLLISNDSGVGHLATAVGTRTITLFGPTPPEFAPFGRTSHVLRPSACPPCFDLLRSDMSCKLAIDYACLRRDLPVDLAESTVLNLL